MPKRLYPGRLHHTVPGWVQPGALLHVRIRCMPHAKPLTASETAGALMGSALLYHERKAWHARLWLLMPDHIHAILAFPIGSGMSATIGAWKGFQAKQLGIRWQEGYFDHRLRNDEDVRLKADYIRMNPVVKGLCEKPEEWPWVSEPFRTDSN